MDINAGDRYSLLCWAVRERKPWQKLMVSHCGLQKKAPVKGKVVKKKTANKFIIDCTIAETDNILDGSVFVSGPLCCSARSVIADLHWGSTLVH